MRLRPTGSRWADRFQWWVKKLSSKWVSLRRTMLVLSGFALMSGAAWMVHMALGMVAAGVSCLVIEYLSEGEAE